MGLIYVDGKLANRLIYSESHTNARIFVVFYVDGNLDTTAHSTDPVSFLYGG